MDQRINRVMTGIVRDDTRGKDLAAKGYTIFPLLNSEQINQLQEFYFSHQKEDPAYFYSSTHSPDPEFRRKASDFIKDIVSSVLGDHLKDYRLLGGAFVVKPAFGKGILPPHQDWNIVDESSTRSYNAWIPLVDVIPANGAVFVLPGSHNQMDTYRGPGIDSIFKMIEQEVWKTLQPLPMKAGEVLLYDHALLHASPVNQTEKIRLGIVCGIIPESATMRMFFGESGQISAYNVDENFFLEKDPMKGPQGLTLLDKIKVPMDALDIDQYNSLFLGNKPDKKNWLSKLLGRNS